MVGKPYNLNVCAYCVYPVEALLISTVSPQLEFCAKPAATSPATLNDLGQDLISRHGVTIARVAIV